MHKLRTVTSLDVSTVAGHHAMPAALLLHQPKHFTPILVGGQAVQCVKH